MLRKYFTTKFATFLLVKEEKNLIYIVIYLSIYMIAVADYS